MFATPTSNISAERHLLLSIHLDREVIVDCYFPKIFLPEIPIPLLLVNDGQDLKTMNFAEIVDDLYSSKKILPLFCVALHCGTDRRNEYGTAKISDYKGRGARAGLYTRFIMEELLPFIRKQYSIYTFTEKAFAGFSLGGLMALDIAWNHPLEFTTVGIFSGSLWWLDLDHEDPDFDENKHRIMQRQIREGEYYPWMKFFFEVGTKDETADRNANGVIDSIDDTLATISEFKNLGYSDMQVKYLELSDGQHNVPTWARAFPFFLEWAWGSKN